ncbi:MAG: YkgJ family cysteine cluster protein [Desulfobacteraceae bacterium]|nr:YkgJ family cysteine cluster protein [Desulfobacteraceae bacterium]MCF8095609.1 YkgJ family cysteine cluster protein [Desulfobacteraceae bacterium]
MQSDPPTSADLFECRQCGECCRGYGGTYLASPDIENIARYLGITKQEFIQRYCTLSAGQYLLCQKRDGYCAFWDGLCTIHPVKPRMCMAWPFIENLLYEPSNWDVMAQACPGIRTGFDKKDVIRCVRRKLGELERYRNESISYNKTGGV